ncbi:hypothetical protein RugamoR57_10940 [Duganella caerulea]
MKAASGASGTWVYGSSAQNTNADTSVSASARLRDCRSAAINGNSGKLAAGDLSVMLPPPWSRALQPAIHCSICGYARQPAVSHLPEQVQVAAADRQHVPAMF